ncbi:hypothetical protein [Bacillus sp. 179-C3.3 HS]|uniref:hypothetical protein n=1 Tax=Bacillus sp. 179-C3.3 HS TaxID=3232162 RepID=UPI0039A1310F
MLERPPQMVYHSTTLRKSLAVSNKVTNIVIDTFNTSEYFQFFNGLLNNEKLLVAAEKNEYKICYMAHPNLRSGNKYFKKNSNIIVFEENKPYQRSIC